MKALSSARLCAFCGTEGQNDTRYAAGYGVLIDEECVQFFGKTMSNQGVADAVRDAGGWVVPLSRRRVDELDNQQMLDVLPRIASCAAQTNRFMADWVDRIRERKMSWTVIGNAMGISRQAAWERFTRVTSSKRSSGTS